MAELRHLNNHHRRTVEQIQQHPTSHNVEYRATVSLLETVADDTAQDGNRVRFTLGGTELVLNRPANGKDLDVQQVVDVRGFLSQAGY
ncbi:hypothetical protein [Amnibacterium endophyticum]|uniref:Uncharacterized protein n=1 Tax=Amnibacterium endophyticum TaxID=2109337 RepID=A0ABW4LCF5_9MICO